MKALNRKLLRDLTGMKAQATAIALVIACGVATYVMALSTLNAMVRSQDAYYERYRFAQVFAALKRAPNSLGARSMSATDSSTDPTSWPLTTTRYATGEASWPVAAM